MQRPRELRRVGWGLGCLLLLGGVAGQSGLTGCGGGSTGNPELDALIGSWRALQSGMPTGTYLDFHQPQSGRQTPGVLTINYSPPDSATYTGTATFQDNTSANGTATVVFTNGPEEADGPIAVGQNLTLVTTLDGDSLTTTFSDGSNSQTHQWSRVYD